VELERAPSIGVLPDLDPLPESLAAVVAIAVGDDVSTDDILPAGAQALPYRSNIVKLAEYAFERLDPGYVARTHDSPAHAIVAGHNYGQGSSREHAAIAPRHLGLRLVIARSYARIHWPEPRQLRRPALEFVDDADAVALGDRLRIDALPDALRDGDPSRSATRPAARSSAPPPAVRAPDRRHHRRRPDPAHRASHAQQADPEGEDAAASTTAPTYSSQIRRLPPRVPHRPRQEEAEREQHRGRRNAQPGHGPAKPVRPARFHVRLAHQRQHHQHRRVRMPARANRSWNSVTGACRAPSAAPRCHPTPPPPR